MTDFDAKSFSIDSTLEFVSDHWSADVPDSVLFRAAALTDRVSLSAGLIDVSNTPQMITAITAAVIDEYEVTLTPTNISGTVRGRDPSALILDSQFNQIYARTSSTQVGVIAEIMPGQEAAVTPTPTQVGIFTAKKIAQDAVASAVDPVSGLPLSLSWEVRDYTILQPSYQVSGRVIDTLRRLTMPWNLVSPYRVDILIQGTTVVVKHRATPAQPIVPQYTFNLTALRRSTLNIRKRRLHKLGTVTLRGARVPPGLQLSSAAQLAAGAGVYSSGQETVTFESTTFDDGGNLVSKVVTTETYRMPDRILLLTVKETYTGGAGAALELSSRETVTKEWEASVYDGTGVVNQPKQLSDLIVREGIDVDNDDTSTFRVLAEENTINDYDDLGFLETTTNVRKKWNFDDEELQNDKMSIKLYHDVGSLFTEQISELYNWNNDRTAWVIQQREASIGGGHRPGGPGRGQSTAGTHDTPGGAGLVQIVRIHVFSTDTDAQNVEFSDENMAGEDLDFIMAMFTATVNLYEYEMSFGGVAMPWIKRGQTIQFTNVQTEIDGLLFTLPPATITEVRSEYVESGESPRYTMGARAFGYAGS